MEDKQKKIEKSANILFLTFNNQNVQNVVSESYDCFTDLFRNFWLFFKREDR